MRFLSPPKHFPYKGYRFGVFVEDTPMFGFQKVSGLSAEQKLTEHRIGGEESPVFLDDGLSYAPVVLQKGVTNDLSMWRWFLSRFAPMDVRAQFGIDLVKRTLAVILMNRAGMPVRTFLLYDATPKVLEYDEFDASSSSVAIERLTVVHRGIDVF